MLGIIIVGMDSKNSEINPPIWPKGQKEKGEGVSVSERALEIVKLSPSRPSSPARNRATLFGHAVQVPETQRRESERKDWGKVTLL